MTDDERLAFWKSSARDTSSGAWTEDHTAGFFQAFRPRGEGLREALAGVAGAEAILPRLLKVYELTADGSTSEDGSYDGYFIVRRPRPIAKSRAAALLAAHFEVMGLIAKRMGDRRLAELLGRPPEVEFVSERPTAPPAMDSPEGWLYETIGDYVHKLRRSRSQMFLLYEGFYSIACDYRLADYLLWPLYRGCDLKEPFEPYFLLWSHNITFRFDDKQKVLLHAPSAA